MRYLSVCSGIEAASVAWHELGWEPVAFSEIDRFPCAVLAHRFPTVPNWGDMTKFQEWPDATVDLLVGGTPCQSFSVAGLRKGMADPRGNLALTFLAIAGKYRPRWILWENVPGVLSSHGGRDFSAFLGGLAKLGYGWAYRVLDAQYVRTRKFPRAVPQRRRRVFVVGCLGNWAAAAAALFDAACLRGDSAPSRSTGERIAGSLASRTSAGGGLGTDFDCDGGLVPVEDEVSRCLNAGGMRRQDWETETLVAVTFAHQAGGTQTTLGYDPRSGTAPTLAKCQTVGVICNGMQVRRLSVTECERLQGFPDGWTAVPYRGKPARAGPRYKALGNSMACNVMAWLGERIQMVGNLLEDGNGP